MKTKEEGINIEQNFKEYWNKNEDEIISMLPIVNNKEVKDLVAVSYGEGALSIIDYAQKEAWSIIDQTQESMKKEINNIREDINNTNKSFLVDFMKDLFEEIGSNKKEDGTWKDYPYIDWSKFLAQQGLTEAQIEDIL